MEKVVLANILFTFHIMIVHFYIHRKFDTIHDFSVWLKTGSNPANINRFRSHTGKIQIKENLCIYGKHCIGFAFLGFG